MSLYIDPGGVMSVVTQMKRTADTLDELQHGLIPRVQDVLWRSQSVGSSLPAIEHLIWQAQEEISHFTHLSNTITDDLRVSAASLTRIAEEAETNITRLSQLTLNAYNNASRYFDIPEILHQGIDDLHEAVVKTQEIFTAVEHYAQIEFVGVMEEITALNTIQQDLMRLDQSLTERLNVIESEVLALSPDESGVEETLAKLTDEYDILQSRQDGVEKEIVNLDDQMSGLFERLSISGYVEGTLANVLKVLGKFRIGLSALGFVTGVIFDLFARKNQGQKLDARTIVAVLLGNAALFGVAFIPGVGQVELAIAGVSVADMLASGVMKLEAGAVHNKEVSAQMQQAAEHLDTASKDLNLGNAADDIGFTVTDAFKGQWGKVGSDGLNVLNDVYKFGQGIELTKLGLESTVVGSADALIQNIPFLPSNIKNAANGGANALLKDLNDTSHLVTNPQDVLKSSPITIASSAVTMFLNSLIF